MSAVLKTPKEWFAASRIKATSLMPYFSSVVMSLSPFEAPGLGTMGVTKRGVLLYDPALSKKWSVEETAWIILHEAGHYLRDHAGRCEKYGALHKLWNYAGDAEINDDLAAAGGKFPALTAEDGVPPELVGSPSGVLPTNIGCDDGKLTEEYYDKLRKKAKVLKVGIAVTGGQPHGSGQKQGKSGASQKQGKGGAGGSEIILVTQGGEKGCGSGSGGEALPQEKDVPGHMGKSPAEQKRIQREVAEAVRREASKSRGTVPGGIARWAEDVLGPPRVPWRSELATECRAAVAYVSGAGDYRYDRPSRRQGAFGYGVGSPVFPALRMPVPQCDIIVDTSGSMGDAELRTALEETKGILSAVGSAVGFFACDAAVHTAAKVRGVKEAMAMLKGGGGTDMKPAIDVVMGQRRRPDLIVCITDGQIGDPGPAPRGVKFIWLVCGRHRDANKPWGKVIELDSKEFEKQEHRRTA